MTFANNVIIPEVQNICVETRNESVAVEHIFILVLRNAN